jgi:hypothetical protein
LDRVFQRDLDIDIGLPNNFRLFLNPCPATLLTRCKWLGYRVEAARDTFVALKIGLGLNPHCGYPMLGGLYAAASGYPPLLCVGHSGTEPLGVPFSLRWFR